MANTPAEENGGGNGKRPPLANPSTSGGLLGRMWSSLRLQKAQRPAITNGSAASTSSMIKRSESDRAVGGGLHSNGNHYAKGHQRPSFTVKDNGERWTGGVQQGSHMNSINGCGNEKGLDRRRRPSSSTKALRPNLRNG